MSTDKDQPRKDQPGKEGVEDYIDELGREGVRVDEGRFSLAREEAQRELSRFQLPDPAFYVLELVQAAVLKGATRIDIKVKPDGVTVGFDGAPFLLEDFEQLYESVFAEGDDDAQAARRLLALGLSVALGFEKSSVWVLSGDGSTAAVHRRVSGQGQEEQNTTSGRRLRGTRIKISRQAPHGHGHEPEPEPEIEVLRERCCYAETPIFLNGQKISGGLALTDTVCTERIDPLTIRGVRPIRGMAGIEPLLGKRSELRLVRHGVWIATHDPGPGLGLGLDNQTQGFAAVVEAGDLRTDISQFDVIRDAAYSEVLSAVKTAHRKIIKVGDVKKLAAQWLQTEGKKRYQRMKRFHTRRQDLLFRSTCLLPTVLTGVLAGYLISLLGWSWMDSVWVARGFGGAMVALGAFWGFATLNDGLLGERFIARPTIDLAKRLRLPTTPLFKVAEEIYRSDGGSGSGSSHSHAYDLLMKALGRINKGRRSEDRDAKSRKRKAKEKARLEEHPGDGMKWGAISAGVGFALLMGYIQIVPGRIIDVGWLVVIGLAVLIESLCVWLLYRHLRATPDYRTDLIVGSVFMAVGVGMFSFMLPHSLNRLFDRSKPTTHVGVVTHRGGGKSPRSTVKVLDPKNVRTLSIPGGYSKGRSVTVTLRRGLFGWYWLERVNKKRTRQG